ncbi:MAG TPA: hypothetical protein VK937_14115 [Candidatus Limnocylindria bacterium]|jgi:hypothetical protein|nr:hypothetical protein [Candidatus Limnocylindria bacterium]
MRFAKIVFWVAGIWGILVITPLYFMFDLIGRNDPPPITHPGFFWIRGSRPGVADCLCLHRYGHGALSTLMIPCVLEKIGYGAAVLALLMQGRMHRADLLFAGTDLLLGLLLVIAYFKTPVSAVVAR